MLFAYLHGGFIDWLRLRKGDLEVVVSPIVVAETALWYLYCRLTVEDLKSELEELGAEAPPIGFMEALEVASKAYMSRSKLPFRHHARDYMIGLQAVISKADIVTYNKKDFQWVRDLRVLTPEEVVEEWLRIKS